MNNRRRHPRLSGRMPVVLTLYDASGERVVRRERVFATTRDLSAGGVRLRHPQGIPRGSRVDVLIATTDPPQQFALSGEVRWTRSLPQSDHCLMGVEFSGCCADDLLEWRRYVASRMPARVLRDFKGLFAREAGSYF